MTGLDRFLGADPASCQDSTFHMTFIHSMNSDLWVRDLLMPAPDSAASHYCVDLTDLALCLTGSLYGTAEPAGVATLI